MENIYFQNSYTLPKTEFDLNVPIPGGTYKIVGNATMAGMEGACIDLTLTLG